MRWEDERYVRLYTRDTATWAMLPWQARCLLPLLLRKLDRAGVIDVLSGEESAALAALLQMPTDVVEPGLSALISRKVVVLDGDRLLMPNFIQAQECSSSDKIRKQVSRENAAQPRASAPFVTDGHRPSHAVTDGHTESQPVTDGHSPSHLVTPNLAVPNCAVLINPPLPPEKPATAVTTEKPGGGADKLWAWMKQARVDLGIAAERARPERLADWQDMRVAEGCSDLAISEAYVLFLRDDTFQPKGWPTAIFLDDKVWQRRMRGPRPPREARL